MSSDYELGSTPKERRLAREKLDKLKREKSFGFKAGLAVAALGGFMLLTGGTGGAMLATLALLGGGATAAGGFGVAGGVAVLIAGGAAVAKTSEEIAAYIHHLSKREQYLLSVNALLEQFQESDLYLIFISYQQQDSATFAEKFYTFVSEKCYPGYKIFLDKRQGHFDLRNLPGFIKKSACIAVLLSEGYLSSRNCMFELANAVKNGTMLMIYQHPAFVRDKTTKGYFGEISKLAGFTSAAQFKEHPFTMGIVDGLLADGVTVQELAAAYLMLSKQISLPIAMEGGSDMDEDVKTLAQRVEHSLLEISVHVHNESEKAAKKA